MQTPAVLQSGKAIYKGNDENKLLYASAIRNDGHSTIKKSQINQRTATSKLVTETQNKIAEVEDSFN